MSRTPGEWYVEGNHIATRDPISGDIVCEPPEDYEESMAFWSDNARLIAAAPDLLEALERIVRLNDAMPEDHSARLSHGELSQAITAISKATGEKP